MCAAHQRDSRRRPQTPGPGTAAEPGRTHLLALPEPLLLTDCGPRACARLVHQAPGSPCGRRRASAPLPWQCDASLRPIPNPSTEIESHAAILRRLPGSMGCFSYSQRSAVGFVMTIYRRRLASSFAALRRTSVRAFRIDGVMRGASPTWAPGFTCRPGENI